MSGVWPELEEHYARGSHPLQTGGVPFLPHDSPVNSDSSVISNGEDAQLLPDSSSQVRPPGVSAPVVCPPAPEDTSQELVPHGDPGSVLANGTQEGKFPVCKRSEASCRQSFVLGPGSTLDHLTGMPDESFTSIMTVKEEVRNWAEKLGWTLHLRFLYRASGKTGTRFLMQCDRNGKARSRSASTLPGELGDGPRNANGQLVHARPNCVTKACDCRFRFIYEFTTDNTWVMTVAHTVHNHEPKVKHPSAGEQVNSAFRYAAAPDVPLEIRPFLDWLISIGVKGTLLTTQLRKACLTKGIIPTFTSQSIRNLARMPVGQFNLDATNLSAWISKRRTEQGLYGDIDAPH
eukprot:3807720-Rhodomonas_salina.1